MNAELFVEVQCEELPARFVDEAAAQLEAALLALLEGVPHGAVQRFASPRHVAVSVADVAAAKPTTERLVTGPPAEKAFADGKPTGMAIGFAKGKGVGVDALQIIDTPKGQVIAVMVQEGGELTRALVAEGLERAILGISFPKAMTWCAGGPRWARPIHAVNALFGGEVIAATVAGLQTGAETVGHRLADAQHFTFTDSGTWLAGLRTRHVEPDAVARRAHIEALLVEAATRLGSDPIVDAGLLDEVVNLVEAPTLVLGAFDEELLALPPRLLVETMKHHQRYFPVFKGGKLTQHFVVISNNPLGNEALIARGNESVLRARFYDARFFFAEDQKRTLEEHGAKLADMQWIRGLGSMADKQSRVTGLALKLAALIGADASVVGRAGALAKCDLASQMVYEFPELQGHMGMLYARAQGEPEAVAQAIEQAWMPRFAGDQTANTAEAACLALAERLDALVGCFGVGQKPKGGDPQGLRRAALGVVVTLIAGGYRVELPSLFSLALANFQAAAVAVPERFGNWLKAQGKAEVPAEHDALLAELTEFAVARWRANATGEGVSADLVDSVIAATEPVPVLLAAKLAALQKVASGEDFLPIAHTFKRVLNITRDGTALPPSDAALSEPVERALRAATRAARAELDAAEAELDFERAFRAALSMAQPVSDFFEAVMVDAEDLAVREVRHGLLREVSALFLNLADFSRISTR